MRVKKKCVQPDMSRLKNRKNFLKNWSVWFVFVLVFGFAAIGFTGCNEQLESETEDYTPFEFTYTVNNPLVLEEHKEGNERDFEYQYITVSGLKNKRVEEKVNNRIKETYEELRIQDLPPYRGTKQLIPEGSEITKEQIYTNITCNCNNILSLMLTKTTTYQTPLEKGHDATAAAYGEESNSVMETEVLNFNLNTGKDIKLKDLFRKNNDAMELVNDNFCQMLAKRHGDDEGSYNDGYSEAKLVEPFQGLSENQNFAIYPFGIAFVLDYRTPQFDTQCSAVMPMAYFTDFGDNIILFSKYYNENKDLYTSTEPFTKSLIWKNSTRDVSGNDNYQDGLVNIYISWRYSSELPEDVKKELERMCTAEADVIKEMNRIYSRMTEMEIYEKGQGAYEVMVYGDRIGGFINTSRYANEYLPDYFQQKTDYKCFYGDTQQELKLGDLFVDGYNYKPVIIKAIRKAVEDYDALYQEGAESDINSYTDQEIEDVFDQIEGFNLSTDEVIIPILHPEKGSSTYGLSVKIPYKDFGCENMTIFD